jgi:hypothetical protein
MKTLIVATTLAAISTTAFAQSHPSTTQMSCSSASAIVQRQGASVLGTGGDTYDRFVRDASFCAHGQRTKPGFARTVDSGACLVGYRCYDESLDQR